MSVILPDMDRALEAELGARHAEYDNGLAKVNPTYHVLSGNGHRKKWRFDLGVNGNHPYFAAYRARLVELRKAERPTSQREEQRPLVVVVDEL